jgi:hypothetical protein
MNNSLTIMSKLDTFVKKTTNNNKKCWLSMNLKKNICNAINIQDEFENNIKDTIELIKKKYNVIYNLNIDILTSLIPNIPVNKQVVLGTFENLSIYFIYNLHMKKMDKFQPFILLSSKEWTDDLNKILISCAMDTYLNNKSKYPIRLLLPINNNQLLNEDKTPRISLLELCIVFDKLLSYSSKYIPNNKIELYFNNTIYNHKVILLSKKKINNNFNIIHEIKDDEIKDVSHFKNTKKWIKNL